MNLIQKLANNDNDEHNVNATHYENDEIDEHDEKNAHGEICKNDQKNDNCDKNQRALFKHTQMMNIIKKGINKL